MILFTNKQEAKERLEICKKCEFHEVVFVLKGYVGRRCTKCGCYIDAKTKFKKQKCPEEKW